jgi:hypothetical protein
VQKFQLVNHGTYSTAEIFPKNINSELVSNFTQFVSALEINGLVVRNPSPSETQNDPLVLAYVNYLGEDILCLTSKSRYTLREDLDLEKRRFKVGEQTHEFYNEEGPASPSSENWQGEEFVDFLRDFFKSLDIPKPLSGIVNMAEDENATTRAGGGGGGGGGAGLGGGSISKQKRKY